MKIVSRDIYKDWYTNEYKSNNSQSIFGSPREEILNFIKLLPIDSSIIELGCGDGRNIEKMLEKKIYVTGVDLIDKIYLNKFLLNNRFRYIQKDINSIDFSLNKYSSLLCLEVLHMFSKEEIENILKKSMPSIELNGYIFVDILSELSRYFTKTGEKFKWDKEASFSIENSKKLLLKIFLDWDILKIGYRYDIQSWPIGDNPQLPIEPYTWKGTYVYIIARKRSC
jgi:SAM-dependent methyltransferase